MTGSLRVVGLGPGPARWITPEVSAALDAATDIVGYHVYTKRVAARSDQRVHDSDNGDELSRAQHALALAEQGAQVVLVSGGDPGVFAMASALCEALDRAPPAQRALEIAVLPGVTAMLAAAARLGAPLGNDFCAINLSDNLKPWAVIEKRLRLAAQADFVIALYNPASKARPEQIGRAFELLREERKPETLIMLAQAIGRPDEAVHITDLAQIEPARCDMRTLVLIGAESTRVIERPNLPSFVYTPRSIQAGRSS